MQGKVIINKLRKWPWSSSRRQSKRSHVIVSAKNAAIVSRKETELQKAKQLSQELSE